MANVIISPSILGYEHSLQTYFGNIAEMHACGIRHLHVDIMRPPFIPGKNTFPEDWIAALYEEFGIFFCFDFHLMAAEPMPLIGFIDDLVRPNKRKETLVTIHREAYRNSLLGYTSKDIDLLKAAREQPEPLSSKLRAENEDTGRIVQATLEYVKVAGYRTGLAINPTVSLENITREMAETIDVLLIMSVSPGAGRQAYNPAVTEKIRQARIMYPNLELQVDGGLNEETIPEVIGAGADNLVIGSYITGADDVAIPINRICQLINQR